MSEEFASEVEVITETPQERDDKTCGQPQKPWETEGERAKMKKQRKAYPMRYAMIAALAPVLFSTPLLAQPQQCVTGETVARTLSSKYGETLAHYALRKDGTVLLIFRDEDGDWTAIIRLPNGCHRYLDEGVAWTTVDRETAGDPA